MILNLLFNLCKWKVEDGGVEVVHGAMVDRHPVFYHQAFIETMGATIATAA